MKNFRGIFVLPLLAAALILTGCGRGGSAVHVADGEDIAPEAELLTMTAHDGYMLVEILDPSDKTRIVARYALVARDSDREVALPDGVVRIDVPVQSTVVYSGVHAGAIGDLGAISAVIAVADAPYFSLAAVKNGLADGTIVDVGNSMQPSVEKIMELKPDLILAATAGPAGLDGLDVPVIAMTDYLERTPLGRAEWLRLLGALYGRTAVADSLFRTELEVYMGLKRIAAEASAKPKVLTERFIDGVWYVPGGRSYMAQMLSDAGASYPWADDTTQGSIPLDMASVLDRAADADFWLIRNFGSGLTISSLFTDNELNARFKAFANGDVWVADTEATPLFDEFPFRPHLMLADMIYIFHPDLRARLNGTRYFKRACR